MEKLTPEQEIVLLNPRESIVVIGKRTLRSIKIYPLSLADQTELTSVIGDAYLQFVQKKDASDVEFALVIKDAIKTNLEKILGMITDETADALMKDITNSQAVDIAEVVFYMNFGILEKKVKALLERVRGVFQSPTSSLPSSEIISSTVSKISPEGATETEG